uniref:Retrovirus-related Pol polyprotein from transposon TNT 1-94-like beta-barrel domain-containing protein n=1 Tax=Populus alba TaxID=43335 RepID=A0A4U5NS60_POPAL|nr:hypothetical protein D5086_0000243240 [Populus alba]
MVNAGSRLCAFVRWVEFTSPLLLVSDSVTFSSEMKEQRRWWGCSSSLCRSSAFLSPQFFSFPVSCVFCLLPSPQFFPDAVLHAITFNLLPGENNPIPRLQAFFVHKLNPLTGEYWSWSDIVETLAFALKFLTFFVVAPVFSLHSRAVTIALGGRSKLGYVNGHIKAPDPLSHNYESWQCKDQLVMSWLLNSMENNIAEIFSYSECSMDLWEAVKEMYGNQNNAARVFQIKRDLANLQQDGKTYVQLLDILKGMWSELALNRPHTIDVAVLKKQDEEDKILQLLSSLGPDYEDLRSRILMNPDLPSLANVCATIQREEARRKIMNPEPRITLPETREKGLQKGYGYKAHIVAHSTDDSSPSNVVNFSTNPSALLNDFANYLKEKGDANLTASSNSDSTAILGKFAGFLANSDHLSQENLEGILTAFKTAVVASTVHNFWVIDSGASDHITNKMTSLHHFEKITTPTHISVANGKHVHVKGKGKIKLLSENIPRGGLKNRNSE